jgi:hypothetical protein
MRFSTVATLLSASLAPVSALVFPAQTKVGDDLSVPGDNPLTYCNADRADDILTITNVDLTPNPPLAGEELVINAVGQTSKPIEKGAYVLLQVKYGLIRLISTTADLCEQITNVDMECPIEKGELKITKSISLPAEIPPGKYSVLADVFTKDDEPITCLEATVVFSRGLFSLEL